MYAKKQIKELFQEYVENMTRATYKYYIVNLKQHPRYAHLCCKQYYNSTSENNSFMWTIFNCGLYNKLWKLSYYKKPSSISTSKA